MSRATTNKMTVDPTKFKFTRKLAFAALAAIIVGFGGILISVISNPSLADPISDITGILTTIVMALVGVVATYMGVNYWGKP